MCSKCYDFLTPIAHKCTICAIPIANDNISECNMCKIQKPYYDKIYTNYLYTEPLRTLLHKFKYQNNLSLTSFLSNLMLETAEELFKDLNISLIERNICLIPVPIHPKRLKKRGFNQACAITLHLAKKLKLPYDINSCRKIIHTPPQAALSLNKRKTNLINTFESRNINKSEVILIDDLITTGNTANELAMTLKKQGIKKVYLWCIARAF
ncbi:MAG: hypothetical protein A3E88_06075 [Legionellales bacterium RIFCSPHIGHO2_12_FULL_35_11]|nr:MAG: hypothetical protein A3E88_06075 [Legionellales bacterium RIFCSPHIGHO2_12_FULL_35_11]